MKYNTRKLFRKKKFKTLKCSPNQDNNVVSNLKGFSCYGKKDILNMKNIWNTNNSNNKIISNDPKKIWIFFKKNLSNKCYNELCWLNDKSFNSDINKNVVINSLFRPFSPEAWKSKPYQWLSSNDIIKVMKQYEKRYKDFVFIGPSPIDFDQKKLFGTCVWEKLCKFDINKYIKTHSKIGIIFNTDPHYKSGSHWVALFINIKEKYIFYFDSNGDKIPNEIKILVDRIIVQGNKINIQFNFTSNYGLEHQLKDGQCGMYTLYFIIQLLTNKKTPNYFKNKRIPDQIMKNYRIKYYNTP
tara:strand:+ start:2165 stop:3058 length:894 start_codon:yes stop_codon:yes gene_type:complete